MLTIGFVGELAIAFHRTAGTIRAPSSTGVTPMQNQKVMSVNKITFWCDLHQAGFYRLDGFSRCEPGTIRNSKDVRIHRNGRLPKGSI